jgi:phosphopantetheinyl transferase (holo-ACP synthase)
MPLSSEAFWEEQFHALDKALPKYDAQNVSHFNKVQAHYRALGTKKAGTPAHWYNEYRSGRFSLKEAVAKLAKELPKAEAILGRPI